MIQSEIKTHGSIGFPMELYKVDADHPRYEMAFHWHSNIEIIRVTEGELTLYLNDRRFNIKKDGIAFVNTEVIHGASPHNCRYECIVYDPKITSGAPGGNESFSEKLATGAVIIDENIPSDDSELRGYINALFEALKEPDNASRHIAIGSLYGAYGVIIRKNYFKTIDEKQSIPHSSTLKLKNALRFIRNEFANVITLDDMAKHAGMSKKYFCSFFKQYTHTTPFEYLITYRIEKASHYLLTTDMDITDIGYNCGFNDLSYFIKTFKRITGVTPRGFRNNRYK